MYSKVLNKFLEFHMKDGKVVFVNPEQVTGCFQNGFGNHKITVINLTSGGYYEVTDDLEDVISKLDHWHSKKMKAWEEVIRSAVHTR